MFSLLLATLADKCPPNRVLQSTWRVLFMCEGDDITRQTDPPYFNECHFASDADPFAVELSQRELLEVVPTLRVAVRVLMVATRRSMCGRIPFLGEWQTKRPRRSLFPSRLYDLTIAFSFC